MMGGREGNSDTSSKTRDHHRQASPHGATKHLEPPILSVCHSGKGSSTPKNVLPVDSEAIDSTGRELCSERRNSFYFTGSLPLTMDRGVKKSRGSCSELLFPVLRNILIAIRQ